MSDDAAKQEAEIKYHERLNISVLSISKIKALIKNDILDTLYAWGNGREVDKQCYHIIGPAGVGKTEITKQICSELTGELFGADGPFREQGPKRFNNLMVKAPVLVRDDFILPFPVEINNKATNEFYSFNMLYSDFVPKNMESFGLFVIDEFSRGDHQLQQLLWQIQNEYQIHLHKFPKNWFVVSIDNPDDSEYSMDNLEDAAGLRRQLHLFVEVNAIDFLNYAIKSDFHPLVVEFIQTHPEYLYDFRSQKMGAVYANPASWHKTSDHLWKMQIRRNKIDYNEMEMKLPGLLNTAMTALFIDFARDQKDINPKDIFYNFRQVKPKIDELLKENNMSKLGELMVGFATFMTTTMPKYDDDPQKLKNVLSFLTMMPVDTTALFISQIDAFDRSSPAFKYMVDIHLVLMKTSKTYKEKFYDPIVKAGEEH